MFDQEFAQITIEVKLQVEPLANYLTNTNLLYHLDILINGQQTTSMFIKQQNRPINILAPRVILSISAASFTGGNIDKKTQLKQVLYLTAQSSTANCSCGKNLVLLCHLPSNVKNQSSWVPLRPSWAHYMNLYVYIYIPWKTGPEQKHSCFVN